MLKFIKKQILLFIPVLIITILTEILLIPLRVCEEMNTFLEEVKDIYE